MDVEVQKALITPLSTILSAGLGFFASQWIESRELRHRQEEIRFQKFHEKYLETITKIWDSVTTVQAAIMPISGTYIGLQKAGEPPTDLNPDHPALLTIIKDYKAAQQSMEEAMTNLSDFMIRGSLYIDDDMFTYIATLLESLTPSTEKIKDRLDNIPPEQFISAFRQFDHSDTEFKEARKIILELCNYLRAKVCAYGKYWQ